MGITFSLLQKLILVENLNETTSTAAVAVRFNESQRNMKIFIGTTTEELLANVTSRLQKGDPTRPLRGVDSILIELCASEESELIKNVPYGSAALRITET